MTLKASAVLALLMGTQPKGMQIHFSKGRAVCCLCSAHVIENAAHILMECLELDSVRAPSWRQVLASMPPAMARDMEQSSSERRTKFLLSGLAGVRYTMEWNTIYAQIAGFVYSMYDARVKIYDTKLINANTDRLQACL